MNCLRRVLILFLCVCLSVYVCCNPGDRDQEETDGSGPVIRSDVGEFLGKYEMTRKGRRVETYRGIRYAQPPVDELRFQPPVPIVQYSNPVNASEDGPACPHRTRPGSYVSEDCLRINVYTPQRTERSHLLPVIVYIHGGGLYSMTARSDLAGPHLIMDRDVVLVTFNYRLGSLGFLSTGDVLAPGNNGFKDQVTALRWVQRNIAVFGGDPTSVTIAGCNNTLMDRMNSEWDAISPISFLLPRENKTYSTFAARKLRTQYLHDKVLSNDEESAKNLVAAHHDDLIYLFSLSYRFPALGTEGTDALTADRLTAIWYNFAKYGDPNPRDDTPELSGLHWPPATAKRRTYLKIDNQLTLHKNLKEDRMNIWEELYPIK